MTDSDTPVLDTLAAMTAESVARCGLDENSLLIARIAALVAVDAPAASYLMGTLVLRRTPASQSSRFKTSWSRSRLSSAHRGRCLPH